MYIKELLLVTIIAVEFTFGFPIYHVNKNRSIPAISIKVGRVPRIPPIQGLQELNRNDQRYSNRYTVAGPPLKILNQPVSKAAGFVIYRKKFEKKIEYLLMQASYENHHWTPPKGHLEQNESDMNAAIRETEEEAGIKVKSIDIHHDFKKVLKYEPKAKIYTKQVTYWLARLINPDTPVILSHEHQDYKWLSLAEAKEKAAYPEMKKLLNDCESYLTGTGY